MAPTALLGISLEGFQQVSFSVHGGILGVGVSRGGVRGRKSASCNGVLGLSTTFDSGIGGRKSGLGENTWGEALYIFAGRYSSF